MEHTDDGVSLHEHTHFSYTKQNASVCRSGSTLVALAGLEPEPGLWAFIGSVTRQGAPFNPPALPSSFPLRSSYPEKKRRNMELIPLTARMVMTHLVNHLGHHPLSGGPALLHSMVSENHDNPFVESSELSSEVFKSPNLQLFVFNDSTLVSYLQIPAEPPAPAGRPPRPSAQVRVIVRDISGKYSWDGAVLYRTGPEGEEEDPADAGVFSPPRKRQPPSSPTKAHPDPRSCSITDSALFGCCEERESEEEEEEEEGVDILDGLLEELGHTSPEVLPHTQLRLNQPAPSPCGMNLEQEAAILEAILQQTAQEEEQVRRWDADVSVRAAGQKEPVHQEPKAPFYFCRLLLNDLGMNSWDRR